MGEQEKELIKVICSVNIGDGTIIPNFYLDKKIAEKFAKALIQRYPQILAEKNYSGIAYNLGIYFNPKYLNKNIEVFIREVKE